MNWFPTERDSTMFRDKVTEVPSFFQDKETSSKSCHGTGQARTACHNPGQDAGQYEILTTCLVPSCRTKRDRAKKDVLKQEKDIMNRKSGPLF